MDGCVHSIVCVNHVYIFCCQLHMLYYAFESLSILDVILFFVSSRWLFTRLNFNASNFQSAARLGRDAHFYHCCSCRRNHGFMQTSYLLYFILFVCIVACGRAVFLVSSDYLPLMRKPI